MASNIYACVWNGDIYKQTDGVGDFIALGLTPGSWSGMAAAPNGDVYACAYGGFIHKQTGGVGDFVAQPDYQDLTRNWLGIAVVSNDIIYAIEYNGDIWKKDPSVAHFYKLNQTNRPWTGIAVAPNGDIYAATSTPYGIYKRTSGSGNFISLNQIQASWNGGMAAASNGDIYANAFDETYKQTAGVGDFQNVNRLPGSLPFSNIMIAPNGDIYGCVSSYASGDIYKQTGGVGLFVALNQIHTLWFGMAIANVVSSGISAPCAGGDKDKAEDAYIMSILR